jgi:hypothetical protein
LDSELQRHIEEHQKTLLTSSNVDFARVNNRRLAASLLQEEQVKRTEAFFKEQIQADQERDNQKAHVLQLMQKEQSRRFVAKSSNVFKLRS